jgi:hypothetical protein
MGLILPAVWLDWVPICGLLRLVCFAYLGKHKHRLYDSVPRVWFRIGVSLSSIRSIRLGVGMLAGCWDRYACFRSVPGHGQMAAGVRMRAPSGGWSHPDWFCAAEQRY